MRLLILTILSFLLSCDTPQNRRSSRDSVGVDTERRAGQPRLYCNERGEEDGPKVSITSRLDFVSAKNVSHYQLKGYCSENRWAVTITVNDFPLKSYPICKGKRWEVFLDLNTLGQETDRAEFKVSHGRGSNVVCKEVRMSVRCPEKLCAYSLP